MRTSRLEDGCLEYTFAADPLEPGRVILFERWENQAALDAHLAAISVTTSVTPRAAAIMLYDVAGERRLR
jgi:quinol monooxygenase YgiN